MGFGRDDALLGSVASCERKVNVQVGFSHFKFYQLSCFYWLCVRVKCCVCIHPIISLASLETESTNATQVHIPNSSCVEWQRPNDGFYKCNIDVAFVVGSGRTRFGFYVRDQLGQFVMARSTYIQQQLPVQKGRLVVFSWPCSGCVILVLTMFFFRWIANLWWTAFINR